MPATIYHQPFCRYLTLVRLIFFADLVTSSALWLAGGDSQYLEDNVTKFQMNQSVFDLALIHILVSVSFIALYTELETLSIQAATRDDVNGKLKQRKLLFTILTFIFTIGNLAYSITKCALIHLEHNKNQSNIHSTYYSLAIASVVFSGVEFVLFFMSILVFKKISVRYARMHEDKMASDGKRDDKKKADLGRLFSLAKPVSCVLNMKCFVKLVVYYKH